jgi:hypothetical protein
MIRELDSYEGVQIFFAKANSNDYALTSTCSLTWLDETKFREPFLHSEFVTMGSWRHSAEYCYGENLPLLAKVATVKKLNTAVA